ncbi:MAG TPA: phosphate ABC transporter permease subunit PstC, partial [Chloroflexota bacterium]|nr:phosphate ABC transporter permease subunit PstC [Chloroflexota bacterium]
YIYGTLVTSVVGLLIAVPIAVGAALYVAEYAPLWIRTPISFTIEMLAAIPSIIYGLWGFFILTPIMRSTVEPALKGALGPIPVIGGLFQGPAIGKDLFTGGVILAIMITPTIMAVSREIILAVPPAQREGMLAVGATRWETIRTAVLPYARSGIAGAAILGLARALGETMAVTMVIGNASRAVTGSLLTPGYTMASAIANQFTEADTPVYFSAIVEVALVLLLVSAVVNIVARLLIWQIQGGLSSRALGGVRV